ncbi:MAG TPA: hypothetical protein DEB24_05785 [Coriobacteriia bacterium]|nr:hypothetical protein [Coriobacteriia bacterium]
MSIVELVLLAIGLSMDAFAVSITIGLTMKKVTIKKCLIVGLYFGIFQAVMPLTGYLLGTTFASFITAFDHWIALILLAIIGGKMIWEALQKDDDDEDSCEEASLGWAKMLPLAVATSIDALAIGVTFAFFEMNVVFAVLSIGIITLTLSMIAVKIGNVFGTKYKAKAELVGGIILVLIGLRIFLNGIGVINF